MTPNEKATWDKYIDRVFSVSLPAYENCLKKHHVRPITCVLDVGCGPGQWSFAAARLNPSASVIGVDTNPYLLDFATAFGREQGLENCRFMNDTYENLPHFLNEGTVDLLMCNSVIQYIDEEKALSIFSWLLQKRGTLLLLWNHGPLYYFSRLTSDLRNRKWGNALYPLHILTLVPLRQFLFGRASQDHFVTFRKLFRLARKRGLKLTRIESDPLLDYYDPFWRITKVFSCKGIKICNPRCTVQLSAESTGNARCFNKIDCPADWR